MTTKHFRNLFGSSSCAIGGMIAVPLFACLSFTYIMTVAKDRWYPNFDLEKLKHPLYSTMELNQETNEYYADYETSQKQGEQWEGFFQFANYTNGNRKVGVDENGTNIFVRSYTPSSDVTGPGNWLPTQCYSSVDYKYNSTVIAYIKNGNQIEEDLLLQIQSVFSDQTYIADYADLMEEFLERVNLGGVTSEEEELAEDTVEEEEEEEALDPNIFQIDQGML